MMENKWHTLIVEEVFRLLGSSFKGLSKTQAKERLETFGPNILPIKKSETIPRILWRQLHNPIVYVLIFSTLLAFLVGKITDGSVVFAVVILNTLIGFIQEYRAYRVIRSLRAMVPLKTTVIRENKRIEIPSSEVVPGDVISLQAGDHISADLRLFSVNSFKCDESPLTGESFATFKETLPLPLDTVLAERLSMAFSGTYVTAGTGLGIVVNTGLETELGKISKMIEEVTVLETPLSRTIKKIAKGITVGVLLISLSLFVIGFLRGNTVFNAISAAIALAVAAIPEGLPAIITIASSIGMLRMAQKKAIIRQLPAVEALGSTTIICTDKTGTLTQNEMTVQKVWTLSNQGEEIQKLLERAVLCSDATLDIGDPTEIALVAAAKKIGIKEDHLRQKWKRKDVIPFSSELRLMATLHASSEEGSFLIVKGAPEEILSLCIPQELTPPTETMAREGMRILAIAEKKGDKLSIEDLRGGFTLLGLLGMIDPPRPEVYKALERCHEAGIHVKMVTGDHPLTAEAIAKELGILDHGKVFTGKDLNQFNNEEWKRAAEGGQVFARVAPEHKLKLVSVLQDLGHVVAMTGDGVNDAAALKRADIGVAMGIKGTAVAKDASDMILADDNFASIESAVEEGRRVYSNLIKSLAFVLPTSLAQALVILCAVLFFPFDQGVLLYPLSPIQILWVNLIVAVALSIPLAFENGEADIMKQSPRKKNTPVISRFIFASPSKDCSI